jgi:hypothetical protein
MATILHVWVRGIGPVGTVLQGSKELARVHAKVGGHKTSNNVAVRQRMLRVRHGNAIKSHGRSLLFLHDVNQKPLILKGKNTCKIPRNGEKISECMPDRALLAT